MTDIAFIIPCLNEQESITYVIEDIKRLFPEARIFVCDNNSKDHTREYATLAGATVFLEKKKR